MRWNHDRKMKAGGRWICAVRRRAFQAADQRRYRATSIEYVVGQRRGRLRRERASAIEQLDHLRREAEPLGSES